MPAGYLPMFLMLFIWNPALAVAFLGGAVFVVIRGARMVFGLEEAVLPAAEALPCDAGHADHEQLERQHRLAAVLPAEDGFVVGELARQTKSRCPTCATDVAEADAVVCPRCETRHHRDCWDYGGGCAIFGCRPVGQQAAVPAGLERRLRRWFWAVRIKWWLSLSFWAFTTVVFGLLTTGFVDAVGLGRTMAMGVMAAYLLVLPLAKYFEWSLGRTIGDGVPLPPDREARLTARLRQSHSRPLLLGLVNLFVVTYAVAGPAIMFFGWLIAPETLFAPRYGVTPTVMNYLWSWAAGLVPAAALWFTARKHRLRLERIRWRLHATVNAGLTGPKALPAQKG